MRVLNLRGHHKFWPTHQEEEQYYFHENQEALTMLHNWRCLHGNLQEVTILHCLWVSKDHTHFKQALQIIKDSFKMSKRKPTSNSLWMETEINSQRLAQKKGDKENGKYYYFQIGLFTEQL